MEWLSCVRAWFSGGERVTVVEVADGYIQATALHVRFEERQFKVERCVRWEGDVMEQAIRKDAFMWLRRALGRTRTRTLFAVDPAFATTVQSTVVVVRSRSRDPIDEADLANISAQALWKLFDRSRAKAAIKMRVGELAVVLTDARVRQLSLDGHRIVNPLGFTAKTVEVELILTMSTRAFLGEVHSVVPQGVAVVVVEHGMLAVESLIHTYGTRPMLFADVLSDRTDLFAADGISRGYVDSFPWGYQALGDVLVVALGVDRVNAEEILTRLIRRAGSPRFLRRIERILLLELGTLAHGLAAHLERIMAKDIYMHSAFRLPHITYTSAFARRIHRHARLMNTDADTLLHDFRGALTIKGRTVLWNPFRTITALLGLYFLPKNDTLIEATIARHTRWLGNVE